jgi:hypothetical protein
MAIKIPTLAMMKKNRLITTYEYSVESLLRNIHGGLCTKMEYIDVPFILHNEEDGVLLNKIISSFRKKGHTLEKVAEVPEKKTSPDGNIIEYVAVRLRIHIEPHVFIEKTEKKTVEKIIPTNRLDAVESDEEETAGTKAKKEPKKIIKKASNVGMKLIRKAKKKVVTKVKTKAKTKKKVRG